MRVLQVIPTLDVGGAERMVTKLSRQLAIAGHAVGVAVLFDPGGAQRVRAPWNEEELRSADVELRFLGKHPGLDLGVLRRLAQVLAEHDPDVVHTHTYVLRYVLPACALAFTRARPLVHTLHTLARHDLDRIGRILHHVAFRLGVVPVAIAEAVAESFRQTYRLRAPRVIPNGIPVADYAPSRADREALRAELEIPPEAPAFVSVARLVREKNHADLIQAFASGRLRALGARLILAGGGELRASLEKQARALEVADRVHFMGERSDVVRVLAAGDVFVLSSSFEGSPLCVIEAMAAARPVVATAVGGVPELVSDRTGALVPPRDVAALERAMFALARDGARARALGEEAQRFARDRLDVSVMARAYEELYAELA